MAITREGFVESADGIQVLFANGRIAGQKIEPRNSFAVRRMQRIAFRRRAALRKILLIRTHLDFQAYDGASHGSVTREMLREQVRGRDDVAVVEHHDATGRGGDTGVARRGTSAVGAGQMPHARFTSSDLSHVLARSI